MDESTQTGRRAARRVAPFPLRADLPFAEACLAAAEQLYHDVDGFHAYLVATYGGSTGVREQGRLLDAAVKRPFSMVGGAPAYPTGLDQAAALLQSLVQNHPFDDGNKRTALYACLYFLEQCGYWRHECFLNSAEAYDLERLVLALATEHEDLVARRINKPYTVPEIAEGLDRILAGSRNRTRTRRRLLNKAFRTLQGLMGLIVKSREPSTSSQ